jgi:hypothetical protein
LNVGRLANESKRYAVWRIVRWNWSAKISFSNAANVFIFKLSSILSFPRSPLFPPISPYFPLFSLYFPTLIPTFLVYHIHDIQKSSLKNYKQISNLYHPVHLCTHCEHFYKNIDSLRLKTHRPVLSDQ